MANTSCHACTRNTQTCVKERMAVRNQLKMKELGVASIVRGYHIYKEIWTPFLMEHLECKWEEGNDKDRYAIAVLRQDTVVGHIARRISAACTKKHLGAAGYHGFCSFHQKLE